MSKIYTMERPAKKTVGKYTAELYEGEDGRMQVDITDTAGNYGSLTLAADMGVLTSKDGNSEVPVDHKAIAQIETWALKNGY